MNEPKLSTLNALELASLRAKGYTAEQILELTNTLQGILDELNASVQTCVAHAESAHAVATAEENVIVSIKQNGYAVAPVDKIVDLTTPTKTSDLTNDAGFVDSDAVEAAVTGKGYLKAVIVSEVPSASDAEANVIYYVPKELGAAGDRYLEYQLINGELEQVGEPAADLSGYATETDVAKASDDVIQDIVNNEAASVERYVGTGNLALFWSLIKPLVENTAYADLAGRVQLLELMLYDLTSNPFVVTFETLDGVTVDGIWDTSQNAIAF